MNSECLFLNGFHSFDLQTSSVYHLCTFTSKIMNSLCIFHYAVIWSLLAARKAYALAEEKLCRAGDFLAQSASYDSVRNYAPRGHWPVRVTSCHIRPMGGSALAPGRSPRRRAFVWAVCRCRSPPAPRDDSRPHSSCGCRAVQSSRVPPNSVRRLWVLKFPLECLCDGGSRSSPRRMLTAHGEWSRQDVGRLSRDGGATWTRSIYKM